MFDGRNLGKETARSEQIYEIIYNDELFPGIFLNKKARQMMPGQSCSLYDNTEAN